MEARQSRIEQIRIDTLRVPPAGKAQRPFREAKGNRIAAEFDINSFGLPVVCQVKGTNWVVDGQHRVYAIQKCGYAKATDSIECQVYQGLTMTEMARMFLGRNQSTPVTAFERFKVAVTAGYPTERAITEIVESLGLKVGYPGTEGNVYSVGALRRVYDRYGANTLERGLQVLRDAYNSNPAGLGRALIDGVGLVLATYPSNRREPADRGTRQGTARGTGAAAPRRAVPRAPRAPGTRVHRCWSSRHLQPPRGAKTKPREMVERPGRWPHAPPQRRSAPGIAPTRPKGSGRSSSTRGRGRSKRAHELQGWANRLTHRYDTLCLEKLKTRNMTPSGRGTSETPASNVGQKRRLNRSLLRLAPAEQPAVLLRSGERNGVRIAFVPARGTSQRCKKRLRVHTPEEPRESSGLRSPGLRRYRQQRRQRQPQHAGPRRRQNPSADRRERV